MGKTLHANRQQQQHIETTHTVQQEMKQFDPVSPQMAAHLRATTEAELQEAQKNIKKLSKNERRKLQDKKKALDAALSPQATQAFYQPGQQMQDNMLQALKSVEENASTQVYAQALTQTVGDPLSLDQLTTQEQTPAFTTLCHLLTLLQRCTPSTMDETQLSGLVEVYHSLELGATAPSHRYLNEMAGLDTESRFVLLYHCVSVALEHMVEHLPPEQVNQAVFAKLYGVASASGMAASKLCCSQAFQQQWAKHIAEQSQAEQEKRESPEILRAKRAYLRTGVSSDGSIPQKWLLGPYAELAEQVLGPEKMQQPWREFAVSVQRLHEALERNLPALDRALDAYQTREPALQLLRDSVAQTLRTNLGTRLLTDNLEEQSQELEQTITAALESQTEHIKLYHERLEILRNHPKLKLLQGAMDSWLIQNLLLEQSDETLFQQQLEHLSQQAEENLADVQKILEDSLSTASREIVMNKLIEKESYLFLTGSPGAISATVYHYLRNLQAAIPEAAHIEATFRVAMRQAGLQNRWGKLADRWVVQAKADNLDKMKAALTGLKKRIDDNLNILDAQQADLTMSPAAWKELDAWAMDQLDQEAEAFKTALDNKLKTLERGASETHVDHAHALYGTKGDFLQPTNHAQKGIIRQQLEGEALCRWSGFGGLFDSYSEPILQALDQLLSQQFFGPVRSLHDLDNLPRSESATLIRQWRSTLAQVAEPWSSLSFPQTRQILIRMLPGILKGDITTENFRQMAEQIQHRLIQETTSVELRFLTQVGQEKAETGQVQYRYLDARRGGHFFTKGSRPGRRVERFQQAEQILSELQEKNLDDRAIRLCHAQVQQHALVEPSTKDPIRVYWDRITKSECAHEMLLSGYEDVILSAPDMARALTHDERDAYEKKLRAMDRRIQAHRNELEQKLQTANLPAEQAQQLTDNFRQMIVRLDEQEREENLTRFGVASWADAMKKLDALLAKPEQLTQAQSLSQAIDARVHELRTAGNGVLQPILNRLMQQPSVWTTLSTGSNVDMEQLTKTLLAQYEAPLRHLKERYFNDPFLIGQMVEECWQKLSTLNPNDWPWEQEFYTLYGQITQHKAGQPTIDDKIHKIVNAKEGIRRTMAPYLYDLIQEEGSAFLLHSSKTIDQFLTDHSEPLLTNMEALNTFLSSHPHEQRMKEGFRQYLRTKLFYTPADQFAGDLDRLFRQYQQLDSDEMDNVQRSKQIMSQRASVMTQIEQRKAAGRQADTDAARLQELSGISSPILAMTNIQNPQMRTIQQTTERIKTQYPDASPFVQGCLIERAIAQDDAAALDALNTELTELITVLCEQGVNGEKLEHSEADAFTTYLLTHRNGALNQDLPDRLSTFRNARSLITAVTALEIKNPALDAERQQVADGLAAGLYTLPPEEFQSMAEKRLSYLRAVIQIESVWTALLAPYKEDERQTLYMGLRDYFHTELLEGTAKLDIESIRTQTQTLLSDELSRQYLINSSSLLGNISYDGLTSSEVTPCTMVDRNGFEAYLAEHADKSLLNEYNALDKNQRQIFALTLTAPGKFGLALPSNQLLQSEQANRSRQIFIQNTLQTYVETGEFSAPINYTIALNRLKDSNGTFGPASFRQAMDFTLLCISRRQENQPLDLDRLTDSYETRTEARRLRTSNVPEPIQPETLTTFHDLSDVLQKQGGESHTALMNKLGALSPMQQNLLIWILQDRTVLDYTQRVSLWAVGGGAVRGVVHEEKRLDMLTGYADSSQCPQFTAESLAHALDTLYSYQLRDDVDLNHRLRKEDFVGLNRKSPVDWDLLDRAMDFLQEMEHEQTRLTAVKNAKDAVMISNNETVKAQYAKQSSLPETFDTPEHVDAFLREQAELDGQQAVYAGWLNLDESQRTLFIKALGQRDILDVSKQDALFSLFGIQGRDYVNPRARFSLIDEHLHHAQGTQGLQLKAKDCRNAILTALSFQINDSVDFTDRTIRVGAKHLLSKRDTAVDWKLVSRALQLVYRTTNERNIFLEDRELYVSEGDLSQTGAFHFDGGFLRQNLHNSGNRFTRFMGRRVRARIEEQIPGPAKRLALMLLPTKVSNRINRVLGAEESGGLSFDKVRAGAESFTNTVKDFHENYEDKISSVIGEKASTVLGEKLEKASSHLGYLNAGISVGKNLSKIGDLNDAQEEAERAKRREQAAPAETAPQTEEQKARSDRARNRNQHLQKQGASKAESRQIDEIVQTMSSLVGGLIGDAVGDESGLIAKVVEEAGELVNFLRNWFQDKKSVQQYYAHRDEGAQLRETLEKAGLTLSPKMDDLSLIRQARGFEDTTEMASFVGLNIVRSLLFCAGPYNPQGSTRILALATLTVLGQTQAIGQYDSETAQSVYDALMGGQYR